MSDLDDFLVAPEGPINFELLGRVRDRIAEVGDEHCDMNRWTEGVMVGSGEPLCGTTACIAGHTAAILYERAAGSSVLDERGRTLDIAKEAGRALNLPGGAFSPLFFTIMWPHRYVDMVVDEGDAKGMLAIIDAIALGTVEFRLRRDADDEAEWTLVDLDAEAGLL